MQTAVFRRFGGRTSILAMNIPHFIDSKINQEL